MSVHKLIIVYFTYTHIYIGHRTPPTIAKMGNKKYTPGARRRGAKKTKKVKTPLVQRPPRKLTPDQIAALKALGFADAYKPETDNDLYSKNRLKNVKYVIFRYAGYGPYQQGEVVETEYDEDTYWVKLFCTTEQEEYNMNLSDPDIVPLLPRAS